VFVFCDERFISEESAQNESGDDGNGESESVTKKRLINAFFSFGFEPLHLGCSPSQMQLGPSRDFPSCPRG
jgi:hypothetical protein